MYYLPNQVFTSDCISDFWDSVVSKRCLFWHFPQSNLPGFRYYSHQSMQVEHICSRDPLHCCHGCKIKLKSTVIFCSLEHCYLYKHKEALFLLHWQSNARDSPSILYAALLKKIKICATEIIIWTLIYYAEEEKSGRNFGSSGTDFLPGKEFPIASREAFSFSSTWPPSCFNMSLLSADKGRGDVQLSIS